MSKTYNYKNTFYITTPIYYVNDVPHIGHAYTTIIADALARFQKLAGREVFFLTGTDEHGQKIEKAASARGMTPVELADTVVVRFKELWKSLNISYDYFIRTSELRHKQGVQKIFARLKEKGDIYKGTYEGWYCTGEENFLPDDAPLLSDGTKICPDCGRQASLVAEETYFFRLTAYQEKLLKFYEENPQFVRPASRMNEVISFVRQGLKDLSITRTSVRWGISVADDPVHTIYVWFDALHNYVTGIGYDWDTNQFNKFWPADIQLIGKDILRFHAIFWPAFLMASALPLPRTIFSHGWWLKDEAKMSKSRGNVLDPNDILKVFGPDALRYFLLREIPIGLDGNFSHEGFIHRVNSDLANDLGNLIQRTLTMIKNYFSGQFGQVEPENDSDCKLRLEFNNLKERVFEFYDQANINRALEEIWGYIYTVNKYLAENEPWLLVKNPASRNRLARILFQAAAAVRGLAYLLFPVMPGSMAKVWQMLGEDSRPEQVVYSTISFEGYKPVRPAASPEPLFPRVRLEDFLDESGENKLTPAADKALVRDKEKDKKGDKEMEIITFEEFKKMDLRVGHILKAERVPGTTKLLKLEIDVGTEVRQAVAGVADTYSPEELTGKKLIVICNLKPAVIRGIESQAMLLAAVFNDKAVIPFFDRDVPTGSAVK